MSGAGSKKARLGCDDVRNIGYIENVLANILSKLPVNSVLKCKLVAKFWYRLIREPQFAQLQFSCSPKNPKLILYLCGDEPEARTKLCLMDRDGEISPYVTLPNLDQNCFLRLICSFNGLICCTKLVGRSDLGIQICNPATREILEVPKGSPSAITPSIGIVFDPDKNKYKVLRFFSDTLESEDNNCKCETYTPDVGDWRRISEVMQRPVANPACPLFPTHLCVGGRMYWLVWSKEDRETPDYILSIDMDDNFTRVELPNFSDETIGFNIFTFLTEYDGCLALVSVDGDESCVEIWSLTNHNESSWFFQGSAELQIDGFVDGINSIVSIENELLFIIKPGFATFFRFHFLNLAEMTWRKPTRRRFRIGKLEPVAFPFAESLFRCDAAN
ncbi:hypothetical protein Pfo_013648 [Paulownia fortunei]|nr:hypothetical protein Pfo_013648 [Paulownia fortunei]